MRATGWLSSGAAAAMPMAEAPDGRGVTCSRVPFVTVTATLQQGARSSAVSLLSPGFAQHASESEDPHQSAARAGRAVEPIKTVTAIAAATRRIGGILLGFTFHDNPNVESTGYGRTADDGCSAVTGLVTAACHEVRARRTIPWAMRAIAANCAGGSPRYRVSE